MILPSKHIPENRSLLAVSAVLLRHLSRPQTVTSLWENVRSDQTVATYERFILALDLLYIAGIIRHYQGTLQRESS